MGAEGKGNEVIAGRMEVSRSAMKGEKSESIWWTGKE